MPASSQRTLHNAAHHLHRRVESRLGLVSPELTRREYVDTLGGFLVAYEALEDSLEGHATGLAQIGPLIDACLPRTRQP